MKTLLTLAHLMMISGNELPESGFLPQPSLCAPLSIVHEALNKKHGESPVMIWDGSEDNDPRQGILYRNNETKSVTLVLLFPDGKGCVVSSGKVIWKQPDENGDGSSENTKGQQS